MIQDWLETWFEDPGTLARSFLPWGKKRQVIRHGPNIRL